LLDTWPLRHRRLAPWRQRDASATCTCWTGCRDRLAGEWAGQHLRPPGSDRSENRFLVGDGEACLTWETSVVRRTCARSG